MDQFRGVRSVAIIEHLQPYHGIAEGVDQQVLYQLSRLNNADKHRKLVLFVSGLINVIFEVHAGGQFRRGVGIDSLGGLGFAPDNARVFHFIPQGARPLKSDVRVQISGTPVVGIKVIDPNRKPQTEGFMNIETLIKGLIDHIGGERGILDALEPLVRRHV
jgi:hypothetical protein